MDAGTTLLTVLATDADNRDNTITYNITYETLPTESGSGSGSGEKLTSEPDIFTFSINSDGDITNDDIFPTVAEDEVRLTHTACAAAKTVHIYYSLLEHNIHVHGGRH